MYIFMAYAYIFALFIFGVFMWTRIIRFIIRYIKKTGEKMDFGSSFHSGAGSSGSVFDFTDTYSEKRKDPSEEVWDDASKYYERNAWEAAREEESAAWSSWQDTNSYYDEY